MFQFSFDIVDVYRK
uniref:IP08447p n=1 Tax=Drosophila melanogaster TaxID=7227 RepID=Q29QN5_DROME|nr:IP08647p [Drosophila melanogaster]ABC86417.1 IP08447p [Drosophila melanogaster]